MTEQNSTPEQVKAGVETTQNLAEAERKAARKMSLGNQQWTLLAALIIYVVYLLTPHAGSVLGFQVTLGLPAAQDANIKITEYIYSWLILFGLGIFTTLTLITKRTVFGLIAWMLVTVGMFYSILAFWLRQTRDASEADYNIGVGMYLSVIAVILAVVSYSMVALRRNPEQMKLARERAERENLDEIGYAQRDAMVSQQQRSYETNPLFVDDRRQRATERHEAVKPAETADRDAKND